ncbi:probable protein phosphatase 2C 33 [Typha angustifolia]|uniref:probable protein phosphatase 2C 33 n=1 Tax=Typha angustifolia TaxID=59011 RepID=UPI003C2F21C3
MPRRVNFFPRAGLPWPAAAGGGREGLPEPFEDGGAGGTGRQRCFLGLNCLLDIIRALKMDSCLLTSPSSPVLAAGVRQRRRGRRRRLVDSNRTEHLGGVPGRLSANGATDVASLCTRKGTKETNQDSILLWENFGSRRDTVFCGVFDGHGDYGHLVSRRVRDVLPLKLSDCLQRSDSKENFIKISGSTSSKETPYACLDKETRISLEDEIITLAESLMKAFRIIDKDLKLDGTINCFNSGTTAVTAVKKGQDLVIANVGDSRAVLGTKDQNNCLVAVQLTEDLKPNLPREEERIRQCNGRVFALYRDVARLWLPYSNTPGLAVARAFGDFIVKDFGLISVPDIYYRRITERDEFLVLASDGVWDVLSNKEVVDIVASAPSRSSAAGFLVKSAIRAWKLKHLSSYTDDCSAVCLFLNTDATVDPSKDSDGSLDSTQPLKLQACASFQSRQC